MNYTFAQYQESADYIRSQIGGFAPKVAMILGSGLGYMGDIVENPIAVPYQNIPHFKVSTAPGHKGQLVFGTLEGQKVAVMQGRMHHYEGYSYEEVSYAVRVLRLLGCDTLIVTNAAGCVNLDWKAGDLMLIADHIKFFMESPLRGENLPEFGVRFPDASHLYTPALREMARQTARELGIGLREGVYMYFPGPQYETPAEVRAARVLGADAAGMSTAPEVITAGHCGMRVLGFTLLSNMGAGILDQPLSEQEVLDAAAVCRDKFSRLVLACLKKIDYKEPAMSILIHNCTAVLMDEAGTVLPNAYVVVEGTKIRSVSTQRPWGSFEEQIDGRGNVLMPGFVNAHSHVPMTAMRGYGDGNNLQDWLHNYIFPVEARWDDRAIRACTDLGLAEMIASGVTTIADMYGHTDAVAQEVAASGISANLCCGGVQFTDTFDPATHHDCVVQRELTEKWHGYNDGQILVDASIHGEYTSHHPLWQWMADYAREHGLGMHVHISETRTEHAECLARHGKTPIQVLNDYGVWDVRAIAAHCVWTTPEDWSVMASKGVSAIHNPMSNLKLGSGIAPVPAMGKAGVNVCLGTDGVSSNNCTDFFGDMKLAAILHNGANCDPLALLPIDALRMATVNGGKALGRLTGRIEGGYDADLILVDFSHLNLTPCHSVISNLAYAAHGSDVCMNMARGKVIYRDGDFLTIDIDRVKREVADYALPLLFETK